MEYKIECDLEDFGAWQGGRDTLDTLIERGDCKAVEQLLADVFPDETPTETDINDFLWFECDLIAQHLGYDDWEAYVNGEDEEDDEEDFLDTNGTPIMVGDKVRWDDEAGVDEDGSGITFTVVEDNGDGYFNIAYEGEKNPERWAYCGELEVLE